jgi:hypothetical protein
MWSDRAEVIWQRWRDHLERVTEETYRLYHYRRLWRDLAEITQTANLAPSVFFDALGVWYISTQGVAVRRQLDRRQGSVSLIRLLEDIGRNPEVATRERHVAAWGETSWAGEAHRNFDRFSGRRGDRIDVAIVRADVTELLCVGEVVKGYVDETIAHTANRTTRAVPTYGDLNAAIDRIADIVGKYASLLNAEILWEFEPVIQGDWQAPFRQAWITASEPHGPRN